MSIISHISTGVVVANQAESQSFFAMFFSFAGCSNTLNNYFCAKYLGNKIGKAA